MSPEPRESTLSLAFVASSLLGPASPMNDPKPQGRPLCACTRLPTLSFRLSRPKHRRRSPRLTCRCLKVELPTNGLFFGRRQEGQLAEVDPAMVVQVAEHLQALRR